MKKQPIKKSAVSTKTRTIGNKSKDNSKAWMIGGVAVLLLGLGGAYYYYRKRKKKQGRQIIEIPEIVSATPTMKSTLRPINTFQPSTTPTRVKFRCNSSTYPLQYGTCNADVKTLQKYLKAKGEYLGRSGSNGDGVDGQFGNLTLKAAKKRLGKSSFSKSDILGLRMNPKMVKL